MVNDVIELFAGVDSCAASDALDSLGLTGTALGVQRLATRRPFCGRAITVRMVAAGTEPAPAAGTPRRHLGTAAIAAATVGDVIVIDNGGRVDVACWGGNLARASVAAKVAGVVIDGAFRDRDECEDLGLSVFARAAVPITARGRIVERDWGQPIEISGVRVESGDIVVADGSGVVIVPQARAKEVAEVARRIVSKESLMAAELDRGVPISEVMGASYEDLLKGTR